MITKKSAKIKIRRSIRTRAKMVGTADQPRLSVFRSNRAISAQLIDDVAGKTLAAASSLELGKTKKAKSEAASLVGEAIAKKAIAAKIKKAIFDRGSYAYHGRVKALADGARKGGLEF